MLFTVSPSYSAFSTFESGNKKVVKDGVLEIQWKFDGSNIHVLVEKKTAGFAVIGLGTNMASADVIQISKTGADGAGVDVKDCALSGYKAPVCTETSQDWTIVEKESTANGFKVEVKRTATSADTANDKNYVKDADNQMIWAVGP